MLRMVELELDGARDRVLGCLDDGWVSSQGPVVREFEESFESYIGSEHAISCSSGTAALHLALKAIGIGHGDEVIVPSYTFVATANAVTYCGATPVFCDVDPGTWCIDWGTVWGLVGSKTRAVIVVHLNGYPSVGVPDMVRRRGIRVVEDACQGLGSAWNGRRLGTLGDIGCFSFFANKQLTTGEGGMCVTDDPDLARLMALYRDQGRSHSVFYEHSVVGFNYRMTSMQAALGVAQLNHIDRVIEHRRETMAKWEAALGKHQGALSGQSPWMYMLRLDEHWSMAKAILVLGDAGIEAKPFFKPCHLQEPYWTGARLPVSESLFGVMLPLHRGVTDEHIEVAKEALGRAGII